MSIDNLRKEVKILCAIQNITYKEISEYLEIKPNSFYNYINGSYELSEEKKIRLKEVINTLKEA